MTHTNDASTRHATGTARRAIIAGLSFALTLGMFGCGSATIAETTAAGSDAAQDAATATGGTAEIHYLDTTDMFTTRDTEGTYDAGAATAITLSEGGVTVDGDGVQVDGSTVTISGEGTYVLSGELSDGQVVVDANDAKVQVVLDGATITSADGAALLVESADKVFVTAADGTSNALATSGAYATSDEGVDGAIYAKDDLVVNGTGALVVTSAEGHGIVGNDDVKLCVGSGGTLSVEAARSAVNANDSVRIAEGGSYRLTAGTDGIHVENAEDDALGYIYVAGGTLEVIAASDGLDASSIIQVDGGSITVDADDDGLHAEADLVVTDGTIKVTDCYEGLEGARIGIDGGDVSVSASDDGLNATGDDHTNTTGDITFDDHGDEAPDMDDGSAPEPPSGFDGEMTATGEPPAGGQMPTPPDGADGEMQTPSGEGAPADASSDATTDMTGGPGGGRGMGGAGGMGGMMDADDSALIQITGGTVYVDADGDGIDSNGEIVMSGGTVQVDGPVNTGNGALDCGTAITITGGTLLATSAGGMEENATSGTTQPTFLVSLGASVTGSVSVSDSAGNVIASWSSDKRYNCVQMSSPDLVVGETYTVACGDTSAAVTLDDTVTGEGTGMGGFDAGMGGMRGGGPVPGGNASESVEGMGAGGGQGRGGMRGPGGRRGTGMRTRPTTEEDGAADQGPTVSG